MLIFDRAVIKKYWPADDKSEDDQIVRQIVMQIEAELENSAQVSDLYNYMIRGLNRIAIMDNMTGEEYTLPAVTVKPFNIKQKKVKIGKGDDVDIIKTEFVNVTLVCRAHDDDGGQMLSDLYRFFNIEVQLTFEEFGQRRSQTALPAEEADKTEEAESSEKK